jgi:hypothetical protein
MITDVTIPKHDRPKSRALWGDFLIFCLSKQRRTKGGRSNIGYKERYEAKDKATIEVRACPDTARSIAQRIAQFVKTLVDRAKQVAIVNGLNRNASPRVILPHLIFLLSEGKILSEAEFPVSAIRIRALAVRRSITT